MAVAVKTRKDSRKFRNLAKNCEDQVLLTGKDVTRKNSGKDIPETFNC